METTLTKQEAEIIATTRVGIIGGGQLGLMMSEAAREMGYARVTVLDPTPQAPASAVAEQIVGSLKDSTALRRLAQQADILTYEIEHINTEALQGLKAEGYQISPSPDLLAIIQNKYRQKEFLAQHGIPVAPFLPVTSHADLERAASLWGYPLVLKARKDAYDGRGNARIYQAQESTAALAKLGDRELYIEKCLPLEKELGLMVARNKCGEIATYPVVEMIHERDICQTVLAPARIDEAVQREAQRVAHRAIEQLQGVGIFGVELFLDTAGKVWLNEIAPRPHNLGHYTIEACYTSQYTQHLRAITHLPLASTELRSPVAVMINILGERNGPAQLTWLRDYRRENVFVHIYGKRETRIDRKMGHITVIGDNLTQVYQQAQEIRAALSI